jgi:thiamine pyrophosphate-dependent acetolactate synthase large subunit-like protein
MTKPNVEQHQKHADQVVSWLAELGYTHCFFVAGGNIMHLLDGVRRKMRLNISMSQMAVSELLL